MPAFSFAGLAARTSAQVPTLYGEVVSVAYVNLGPDGVREVQVLVDGQWVLGDLEAYRRDATGAWYGWVRWRRITGQSHVDWFTEEQVRPSQ